MFGMAMTALLIITALLLTGIADMAYAQQVQCPTNKQQRERECNKARQYVKYANTRVAKWETNITNAKSGRMVLAPWRKMNQAQYKGWAKPNKIVRNGGKINMRVYGTYRDSSTDIVYLMVANQHYVSLLKTATKGNTQKATVQYKRGLQNSKGLANGSVQNSLKKSKQRLQRSELFLSQCCGYRWTNEVGREDPQQPQRPEPNTTSNGLLGIEAQ